LFAASHAIELIVRLMAGGAFPGYLLLLSPVIESLLWPVVSVILLMPQRRTPNPDAHRPL
jgi:rod shape-determining protein MreD